MSIATSAFLVFLLSVQLISSATMPTSIKLQLKVLAENNITDLNAYSEILASGDLGHNSFNKIDLHDSDLA